MTLSEEKDARIQMLTNAVEQTADSIVITDRNGLVEYVNPAFEITTGYPLTEIRGQSLRFLKSGMQDAAFYKKLWTSILSGETVRQTIANRKKSGDIYFAEQTITPMRDSAGKITNFVSVIKDITEQKKLQEQQMQMELARSVQQQFYQIDPPKIEGYDLAGASFPADATGGDYFDFVPLQQSRMGIVIGDVSGHGMSSALLMVALRAYLRAFALNSSNVGEILSMLNSTLKSDLEPGRYATLAFYSLNPATRSFVYANAGHVPGYILNASGEVRQSLDSTDVPLGLMPNHIFNPGINLSLNPGEILVLLTDGILEAEKPSGESFGVERTIEYIKKNRRESAQQIITGLFKTVRDFSDGLPQADDITAVICKSKEN
jgi:PAS domain S-box-containing protein